MTVIGSFADVASNAGYQPAASADELVANARRLAAKLNATLDELGKHDIDCTSVIGDRSQRHDGGLFPDISRVSLLLNFKAKTAS